MNDPLSSEEAARLRTKLHELDAAAAKIQRERNEIIAEISRIAIPAPDATSTITPRRVVLVGGGGAMGHLFTGEFRSSGHHVEILERDDWNRVATIVVDADAVVISVPIASTQQVIRQIAPYLSAHTVLADLTSTKSAPLAAMLHHHRGPVLGLHPMFGPHGQQLDGQVVVACPGRMPDKYQWILDWLISRKAQLRVVSAEQHDRVMGFVQAIRHVVSVVFGRHLFCENVDIEELLSFSSPIYRLELAMVGRIFAQDPELYAAIAFESPVMPELLYSFRTCLDRCIDQLEQEDRAAFIRDFREVKTWMSKYAEQFLSESTRLLRHAPSPPTTDT